MTGSNIFPMVFGFPQAIYPIVTVLLGGLAFTALFQYGYNRILENLYGLTKSWGVIKRVQTYLFLLNLPLIVYGLVGITINESLLPLQVSLKIDQFLILVVSGYICYLDQSRQTPIRGCPFLKDLLLAIAFNLALLNLYLTGEMDSQTAIIALPIFLFALILQSFTNQLENCVLLALGVRQHNIYRADFLLTQKVHPPNFLQIKDIITTHQTNIQQELDDFKRIAAKLKRSNQQLNILVNLGRLFIPIKAAYQIYQDKKYKKVLKDYQQNWQKSAGGFREVGGEGQQDQSMVRGNTFDQSASSMIFRKTFTTDSFVEQQPQQPQEQNCLQKIIKCVFYPLFLSTSITGRPRIFMDYLIFILVLSCMFVLSHATAYLSLLLPQNQNITGIILALILGYPTASYFIKVSGGSNDYDFISIFIQGMFTKITISSAIILVMSILSPGQSKEYGQSWMVIPMIRSGSLLIYGIFLAWKRFAIRFAYFKVFLGLFIFSQVLQIVQESLLDHLL